VRNMRSGSGVVTLLLCGIAFLAIAGTLRSGGEAAPRELIIFDSERDGKWGVYTVRPDGSGLRRLTHAGPQSFESWEPDWSPDRKSILFNSNRHGGEYELYVMDADGSNVRRLTFNQAWDGHPDW